PAGNCGLGFFEGQTFAVTRQKDYINGNSRTEFHTTFGVSLRAGSADRDYVSPHVRKTGKNRFAFLIALGVVIGSDICAKNINQRARNGSSLAVGAHELDRAPERRNLRAGADGGKRQKYCYCNREKKVFETHMKSSKT